MTNKEKLSQTNSEELAEFIDTQGICGLCNKSCELGKPCFQGILEWLESEVEE